MKRSDSVSIWRWGLLTSHLLGEARARLHHTSTQWVATASASQPPQSQPMHPNSNGWENPRTISNFWGCLQLQEYVFRSPVVLRDQFWCVQFSRPTVIHLLHLGFWLCYSFSKLKCSLCSKISLVFKAKLVSYKNFTELSLINPKQNASVFTFTKCIHAVHFPPRGMVYSYGSEIKNVF